MIDFLRKLFRSSMPPSPDATDDSDALYEEFCRTFCHQPGVNFIEFLKAEDVTRMIAWLRPATRCAIPKGFIRLAVSATRKGENVWDMPGIRLLSDGVPGQESMDAVSVLAQILGKTITVFYREEPSGQGMVMKFGP
jgi:hypothetical protein